MLNHVTAVPVSRKPEGYSHHHKVMYGLQIINFRKALWENVEVIYVKLFIVLL